MNPRKRLLLAAFLVAFFPLALAQGTYTQIDVPGAVVTGAWGINTAGDVVGQFTDTTGNHGFLLRGGVFTALDVPNASYTSAIGINDIGQIVGQGDSSGFLYDIQTQTFTTFRYSQSSYTSAFAVNNAGTIAGAIGKLANNTSVGFEFDGTTYTIIKAPGASKTFLSAVDNLGEAMVSGQTASGVLSYYLFSQGRLTRITNPSSLEPWGINDTNTIAGTRTIHQYTEYAGFVKQGAARQSLTFPASTSTFALSVNNAGVVVGYFYDASGPSGVHGFMWTPPGDAVKK